MSCRPVPSAGAGRGGARKKELLGTQVSLDPKECGVSDRWDLGVSLGRCSHLTAPPLPSRQVAEGLGAGLGDLKLTASPAFQQLWLQRDRGGGASEAWRS